ncbi:hypothetical protein [Quadrisphaera setariae]|uniref:Uncharacterized protein n=1 Tax=Quadrisphaera setariae TaxID=2593304 RepID=A0A5C8ZJ99_9ACTN|nr:hypothetical protein [Quadrisphaera setariae]TXR57937.1 hypothetical protein FMM08_01520 [Quadrisphaera setariae]
MHRATPLPDELAGRPFRVDEALALGVTRKRLDSADLWAPFRGVRVPVALGWDSVLRGRAGLLVCPPGTILAGLHAVAAAGLRVPVGLPPLDLQPLLVSPPFSTRGWSRQGFAVDTALLPRRVPLTSSDGALRPSDADLWARTVAWPWLPLTPFRRRAYSAGLAIDVADRIGPGTAGALSSAFWRLPPGLRPRAQPLLELVLQDLAADDVGGPSDSGSGRG